MNSKLLSWRSLDDGENPSDDYVEEEKDGEYERNTAKNRTVGLSGEDNSFNRFYGIEKFIQVHLCSFSLSGCLVEGGIQLHHRGKSNHDKYCGKELDLAYLPVQDEDLIHLSSFSNDLKSLSFAHCSSIGRVGLKNLSYLQLLVRLDLSYCRNICDESCSVIKENFNRLRCLKMRGCNISDTGIIRIMEGCLYLETISFGGVVKLGDRAIQAIETNLSLMNLIAELDLSRCTRFSNESLISLLEHDGGVIKSLDISYCTQINIGLIGFKRNFTTTNCHILNIRGINGICNSTMSWLSDGCKYLKFLDLSFSRLVDDSALSYLSKGCTRLNCLLLTKCTEISDSGFADFVFNAGRNLKTIVVRNCSQLGEFSGMAIAKSCQKLVHLDIFGVPRISNESLHKIAKGCRWLEYVDFSADINSLDLSRKARVPRIGGEGIRSVGQYCKGIKVLKCNGASMLDSRGLMSTMLHCANLIVLHVRYCFKIEDYAVMAVSEKCHELSDADFGCCVKISDRGIIGLSQGCRKLKKLNLLGLRLLTDKSIKLLARRCPNLSTLILRGCEKLTDISISILSKCCRSLTVLDLNDIGGISDFSVCELHSCNLIRLVDFTNTEASYGAVANLARQLPFAVKVPARCKISPVHHSFRQYKQFVKYHDFLAIHQKNLSKTIRAFICKRAYIKWRRIALSSCIFIQTQFRRFEAVKKLKAKHRGHALKILETIACIFKFVRMKANIVGKVVTIQSSCRRFLARKQFCHEKTLHRRRIDCDASTLLNEDKKYESVLEVKNRALKRERAASFIHGILQYMKMTLLWESLASNFLLHKKINDAICVLQSWWLFRIRFIRRRKKDQASVLVQKLFRCFRARKAYIYKQLILFNKRRCACLMIQSWMLHFMGWRKILKSVVEREKLHRISYIRNTEIALVTKRFYNCMVDSVTTILHRNFLRKMVADVFYRRAQVCIIQKDWRRRAAVKRVQRQSYIISIWARLFLFVNHRNSLRAATKVQKWIRLMNWKISKKQASIVIQCLVRRKDAEKVRKKLETTLRHNATCKIQTCYRIYWGRCYRSYWWWQYNEAASAIQKIYKRHKVLHTAQFYVRKLLSSENCLKEKTKRELIIAKYERQLRDLFAGRDNKAAFSIQHVYRQYRARRHHEKKLEEEREEKALRQIEEEKRRRLIYKIKSDKESLCRFKHMINTFKATKFISSCGQHAQHSQKTIARSDLRVYSWFNEELFSFMDSYNLNPLEVIKLYNIFQTLDYLREGVIDIIDFLDMITEPTSVILDWVFDIIGIQSKKLVFVEYLKVVCFLCTISRDSMQHILFSSMDKFHDRIGYFTKPVWTKFVKFMTEHESITHETKTCINAFDRYGKRIGYDGLPKLFFEGFTKVLCNFPFLAFPLYRLQSKAQKYHMGKQFWDQRQS